MFGSPLSPVVCRRDHVLFLLVACVCLRVVVSGTGGIMSYFCWLRVFVYVWWCPAQEGSCLIFVGCVCLFTCGGVRHILC